MNRRKFLTKAGVGSLALAALPALTTPALADGGQTGFRFVSNSRTATVEGVRHFVLMNGDGIITNAQVVGGGSFNHIIDTSPVPKTIVATGTWKAKRLISFRLNGTYGALASGILEMEVNLIPIGAAVVAATIEVVCNIGPAGLFTGEEEGFILSIPGTPFVPGGTFGPFEPFGSGLTIFTLLNEHRD